MKKSQTVTETREVVSYFCDTCGEESKWRCSMCNCDVCQTCAKFDPSDYGDYPSPFCPRCWTIGEPFRAEAKRLGELAVEQIELWRQSCRKTV